MPRQVSAPSTTAVRNRLLAALRPADLELLLPHLKPVDLPLRHSLEAAGQAIDNVYFLESGIASVVAVDSRGRRIEAGIIGNEGMTGVSLVLGADSSPNETFIQIAARGHRIAARRIREAMQASATLREMFLRFANAFMVQTTQTALANGRGRVEERLARWLLMARDRVEDDSLPLTHEFLALMLGVRRSGVTVALHELEGAGFVKSIRGVVIVRDRSGLERLAAGFYGVAEAELGRLL